MEADACMFNGSGHPFYRHCRDFFKHALLG